VKKKNRPETRTTAISSHFNNETGEMSVIVKRGALSSSGAVMYKLDRTTLEAMAHPTERQALAVAVNNLGLLVLSQLTGFSLAENLDKLGPWIRKWAHLGPAPKLTDDQILAIAQKNLEKSEPLVLDQDDDAPHALSDE